MQRQPLTQLHSPTDCIALYHFRTELHSIASLITRFTHCYTGFQVRWQGRDAEGRPILVVRVAQACQECSSIRAEVLAQAILSQVHPPGTAPRPPFAALTNHASQAWPCTTVSTVLKC